MKHQNITVIGGAGFIASHLVDRLIDMGKNVTVVDSCFGHRLHGETKRYFGRKNFQFVKGDIRDKELAKKVLSGADVVYHFASLVGTDATFDYPILATEVNVIGTLNMLQRALECGVKYFVYPATPDVPWLNPYKITKEAGEKYCRMYYFTYGLKTVCLTLNNVYGPRERMGPFHKIIPTFVTNALLGKPLPIFGDGKQSADYVYVSDVVDAFTLAPQDRAVGKVITIGRGASNTVNEIARLVLKLTRSKSKLKYLPMRPGEVKLRIQTDTGPARKYLGWRAKTGLEEGLRKTIPYYAKLVKVRSPV